MERMNEMRVLEGLEEIQYYGLLLNHLYHKTHDKEYHSRFNALIVKTLNEYGLEGVFALFDFVGSESDIIM